jgi:hypothetical protein
VSNVLYALFQQFNSIDDAGHHSDKEQRQRGITIYDGRPGEAAKGGSLFTGLAFCDSISMT